MMIRRDIRGVASVQRAISKLARCEEIAATTRYGSKFFLRPADYIDRIVLSEGYYESEVLQSMLEDLPHGATVWDVGANFGLHGITLKCLRPDAQIVCFEPSPEQAARVVRHAALNNVTITLCTAGLGQSERVASLHVVSGGNPGMTTFVPWSETTYSTIIKAHVTTADKLIEDCVVPAPNFIKLDIEGGEHAAIEGMRRTIDTRRPRLLIEGSQELAEIVRSLGYRDVSPLKRQEASQHNLENYLCVP